MPFWLSANDTQIFAEVIHEKVCEQKYLVKVTQSGQELEGRLPYMW